MSRQRHVSSPYSSYQLPTLPFLSIMLGLMSIMALATMGISVQQRSREQQSKNVELVGIPSNFIPHHMRCTADSIFWLDESQKWRETSYSRLYAFITTPDEPSENSRYDDTILDFISRKVTENKKLSFSNQQNSLILWVEPEGVDILSLFRGLISIREIPLRVGLLPILQGEKIYHGLEAD